MTLTLKLGSHLESARSRQAGQVEDKSDVDHWGEYSSNLLEIHRVWLGFLRWSVIQSTHPASTHWLFGVSLQSHKQHRASYDLQDYLINGLTFFLEIRLCIMVVHYFLCEVLEISEDLFSLYNLPLICNIFFGIYSCLWLHVRWLRWGTLLPYSLHVA